MRMVLIIALVAVAVVAVLMMLRPSGPRVTTIERRRVSEESDDPEEGDRA
ncbi:MAG TPA: hypothetical protein VM346_08175 [Sphingomicrobium sp.]|jgi:uncharacterized membrane protein YozB (DUF420 family)|nr:hypothetical protein [Sphingomicrobium sp.]